MSSTNSNVVTILTLDDLNKLNIWANMSIESHFIFNYAYRHESLNPNESKTIVPSHIVIPPINMILESNGVSPSSNAVSPSSNGVSPLSNIVSPSCIRVSFLSSNCGSPSSN